MQYNQVMKFLVIDDDICIYSLLRKQIKGRWKDSYVEHFNPALQGIPSCDFNWSEYDIVLLDYDIGLSSINGLDILTRLDNMDNFPIVIMITGEGNENVAVRAIQAGADDYLIKYDIVTDRFHKVLEDAMNLRENIKAGSQENRLKTEYKKNIPDYTNSPLLHIDIPGYQCLDTISSNISMTVYAVREEDRQPVALKLQKLGQERNSIAIKRFNRELNLLAHLEHPNVINIIEHGITEHYMFYSMEYIEHGDMNTLLTKGPIPTNKAIEYFQKILHGVSALHNLNIIHRDIKARNILFRTKDTPVIADLGSAKRTSDISDITIHGEVIGTPYYMSPEQFNGDDVDHRSDIYNLGVLFYEMITGQKPFIGDNIMELVYKQTYEKPAKLPEAMRKYQEFINKMISIDRNDRFQNINEITAALNDIH